MAATLANDFSLQFSLTDRDPKCYAQKLVPNFAVAMAPVSATRHADHSLKKRGFTSKQNAPLSSRSSDEDGFSGSLESEDSGVKGRNDKKLDPPPQQQQAASDVPDQKQSKHEPPHAVPVKSPTPLRPPPGITVGANRISTPPPGVANGNVEQWVQARSTQAHGVSNPQSSTYKGSNTTSGVNARGSYVGMAANMMPMPPRMSGPCSPQYPVGYSPPMGMATQPGFAYGPMMGPDGLVSGQYPVGHGGVQYASVYPPQQQMLYAPSYAGVDPHNVMGSGTHAGLHTMPAPRPIARGYGMMNGAADKQPQHGNAPIHNSYSQGWQPYPPQAQPYAVGMLPQQYAPAPVSGAWQWQAAPGAPPPPPPQRYGRPSRPVMNTTHCTATQSPAPGAEGSIFRNWQPYGSVWGPEKQVNAYPEYDDKKLHRAATAVYFEKMGMKAAATRFNVTYADLKHYYDNEFRPEQPGGADSDDQSDGEPDHA